MASETADAFDGHEVARIISETFDIGFLAGRLWSEYRTKIDYEEIVEKGEASLKAQAKRTTASGRKSAEKRLGNLEQFMTELEKLAPHFQTFSESVMVEQAYDNASKVRPMPGSRKTREEYETALRSEEPFRSRYNKVFQRNA